MILPITYLEGFGVQFHYNVHKVLRQRRVQNRRRHGPCAPHTGVRTGHDSGKRAESGTFITQSVQLADQKMATRID